VDSTAANASVADAMSVRIIVNVSSGRKIRLKFLAVFLVSGGA
jgi:hypothetical protein